jgi:T-complex protein 1 subunit theta
MGDATNMVLILAGELLKRAENLLIMGLHPSEIMKGYELACARALEELESPSLPFHLRSPSHASTELSTSSLPSPLTKESLASALRPSIASKQYGHEDALSALVAEAALAVLPANPTAFNVDNVRVVKVMGGSLAGSAVVPGMVFGLAPEGDVRHVRGAKVAVYTSALDVAQSETKGTVLIKNKEEMLNFTRGEEQHIEKVPAY